MPKGRVAVIWWQIYKIFQIIKEKSNQTMTEKNFQIQQIKNKMFNNAYYGENL
jgi:hypothetical protein